MFRIVVCDDQQSFAQLVKGKINEYCLEYGIGAEIFLYTDSSMLLYDIEENLYIDMFFLDIQMPELDGMSLAAGIRKKLPQALILFITSHNEYAIKAYELSIFRYIPKLELDIYLPLALADAVRLLSRSSSQCLLVESSKKIQKVVIEDILYIYKDQKNAVLVLNQDRVMVRKPLILLLEEIKRDEFLMIERGYIVNLYHVVKMENSQVLLDNGAVLPVSKGHQKNVREKIGEFWRKRL